MRLCRFQRRGAEPHVGLLSSDSEILDLAPAGVSSIATVLGMDERIAKLSAFAAQSLPRIPVSEVELLPPVDEQEVWAAGVTYLRSKKARMEESNFSATAYDRVYEATRPELFFKSLPEKVSGPGQAVGIRPDSKWSVPEPELALVLDPRGQIAGYTIGNDMSSRDIEGENLLYLPQAKIYDRSCALGPWILCGPTEQQAREWEIRLQILRNGRAVFSGETKVDQIKRGFDELASFLFRSQSFAKGAVLLTGTGIVPPDHFSLHPKDAVEIEISGIGTLRNEVVMV